MKNKIPICFIHSGIQYHLDLSINQARHFNPNEKIYLLGDQANKGVFDQVTHLEITDTSKLLSKFEEAYKHASTNSFEFEYNCFKRWFLLLEFMRTNSIDWVCTLDSDFMLFDSMQQYFDKYLYQTHYLAALCIPDQKFSDLRWTASGHIAFVKRLFLEEFCHFVLDIYTKNFDQLENKIQFHKRNNLPGGICDMTLLYLFYEKNKKNIYNLLNVADNHVFDHNINTSANKETEEFATKDGFKEFTLKNSKPYAFNNKGLKIYFRGLHFQGNAKKEMIYYYFDKKEFLKFIFKSTWSRVSKRFKHYQ